MGLETQPRMFEVCLRLLRHTMVDGGDGLCTRLTGNCAVHFDGQLPHSRGPHIRVVLGNRLRRSHEDSVNFYDFALLFRDRLKCNDALHLDGSVSRLYAQSLGRHDERVPLGPIIGVTESAAR
jgi:hypothetical protein